MLSKNNILFILLSITLIINSTAQSKFFVSPKGNGDGGSWTSSTNLKNALKNAEENDVIWIKEGIYYPVDCIVCTTNDRSQSFEIPSGIKLYGGFSGTEVELSERPENSYSVFDGDIDKNNALSNNSFSLVFALNTNANTLIDGIEFMNANGENSLVAPGSFSNSGGGVYFQSTISTGGVGLSINNCKFTNNHVFGFGGGVYVDLEEGSADINCTNTLFENNSATSGGGAIYSITTSFYAVNLNIASIEAKSNVTEDGCGGAIVIESTSTSTSQINIDNSLFNENSAKEDGGAISIYEEGGYVDVKMFNNEFIANQSGLNGGALSLESEGKGINFNVNKIIFSNNSSNSNGGAISIDESSNKDNVQKFLYCNFMGNIANGRGGAIHHVLNNNAVSEPFFQGGSFSTNTASSGGGIYFKNNELSSLNPTLLNSSFVENNATTGGGIHMDVDGESKSKATLIHNTFYKNTSFTGGAISAAAEEEGVDELALDIIGSVFSSNTGLFSSGVSQSTNAIFNFKNSAADVASCRFMGRGAGESFSFNCDEMIFEDINFVDETNHDLRPNTGSSVIDKGDNTYIDVFEIESDVDSNYRFDNLIMDLGAYESKSGIKHDAQYELIPEDIFSCNQIDTSIRIIARGNGHFDYKWFKDNEEIDSTNTRIIKVTGGPEATGYYQLRVIDEFGELFFSDSIYIEILPSEGFSVVALDIAETCESDSIILESSIIGPEVGYNFEWFQNGEVISTKAKDVLYDFEPNDEFYVKANSNNSCLTNSTSISDTLRPSIINTSNPEVSINDPGLFCASTEVTLETTFQNEGDVPLFKWFLNDEMVQENSSSSITFDSLKNSDEVKVVLVGQSSCQDFSEDTSEVLAPNVMTVSSPVVELIPSTTSICEGIRVDFSTAISNTGSNVDLEWYLNDELIAENVSGYTSSVLQNGDQIFVEAIPATQCPGAVSRSEVETITVISTQAPILNIDANGTDFCKGDEVDIVLTIENLPSDNYEIIWKKNDAEILRDEFSYQTSSLETNDRIKVELMFESECSSNGSISSNQLEFNINDVIRPEISISTNTNPVCEGSPVTFFSFSNEAVDLTQLKWFKNGVEIGMGANMIDNNVNNGDVWFARLDPSSVSCVEGEDFQSNSIVLGVTKSTVSSISIDTSSFEVCRKNTFTVSATGKNIDGNSPIEWFNDKVKIGEGSSITFEGVTSDIKLIAKGEANLECTTEPVVESEPITITALDELESSITFEVDKTKLCDEVDPVKEVRLIAKPKHGGSAPQYKWYFNDRFTFLTNPVLRLGNFNANDSIRLEMISNNECVTSATQSTSTPNLSLEFDCDDFMTSVSETENAESEIRLYPNPARETLFVDNLPRNETYEVKIIAANGVLVKHILFEKNISDHSIDLTNLVNGTYYVQIVSSENSFATIFQTFK